MAKLGQLFLQDGLWGARRVVSPEWVEESTREHVTLSPPAGYGYQWRTFRHRLDDGREVRSFAATGHGGQFIFVVRELNMVVVFTQGHWGRKDHAFEMLERYVLPAAGQPRPVGRAVTRLRQMARRES